MTRAHAAAAALLTIALLAGCGSSSHHAKSSSTSTAPTGNASPNSSAAGSTTTPSGASASSRDLLAYRPVLGQVPARPNASAASGVECADSDVQITPRAQALPAATIVATDRAKDTCLMLGPTIITGHAITHAEASFDATNQKWVVALTFGDDEFLTKVAGPYVNQDVAVLYDGVVQADPKINPGITGRTVELANLDEATAKALAQALTGA